MAGEISILTFKIKSLNLNISSDKSDHVSGKIYIVDTISNHEHDVGDVGQPKRDPLDE